jgi:hypothetical protein
MMNDEDFRDVCAIFAMHAMLNRDGSAMNIGEGAYRVADMMLEARKAEPEEDGIVAIKKRKYVRKS